MCYTFFLKSFITLLASVLFPVISSSTDFSGTVYLDLNRNNLKEATEKGIKGVAVTDGLNVVLTDEDGHYHLPGSEKSRFIYITVPSGYKTVDRFYIRKIDSIHDYSFGLSALPFTEDNTVRFLQLADTEAGDDFGWVGPIRDYAANENIDFIVHTGDICYEKGLIFHGKHVTSETMGVPVYYCVGNHDLVQGNYGEEMFEYYFGPPFYSFEAGNTHFIVTPMLAGDYRPSYTKEDVYRWMKNDLRNVNRAKNLVVFNHNLLTMEDEFIYGINDTDRINLNDHNLKAWIYGHWHSNYLLRHGRSGIISVCTAPPNKGGIDHSASNFPVYAITGNGEISIHPEYNYLIDHFAAVSPVGIQCAADSTDQLLISVNTYSTRSPTETVEFRIDGTEEWKTLTRQSGWNWSASYPVTELKKGISYRIWFRTRLANGDLFTRTQNFVISGLKADNKVQDEFPWEPLTLKWIVNTGSNTGMGSPVYSDGLLYVAAYTDYSPDNRIIAYDGNNGRLRWQYKTAGPVKNTISVEDGLVLATDEGGIAYALEAKTGEPVWIKDLGIHNVPLLVTGGVVDNGIYYCGFGNYLSALDCSNGSLIWKNDSWNGGEGTTSTMSVIGNTLIAGSNWRALYGHDIHSGDLKWEIKDHGIRFCNGTASWVDDTLFFAAERAIVKMDPASGSLYSVNTVPYDLQVASQPLVTRNMIVTGASAEGLAAFDRHSLKELWKVKPGTALVYTAPYSKPYAATVETSPVLVGDMIAFGASDGFLYLIDQANGRILSKINLGAPVFGRICLEDNVLYVADFSGNVSCFSVN